MEKEMSSQSMCGRFYIDDETAKEIEKIARKIDRKMAKLGFSFHRGMRCLFVKNSFIIHILC